MNFPYNPDDPNRFAPDRPFFGPDAAELIRLPDLTAQACDVCGFDFVGDCCPRCEAAPAKDNRLVWAFIFIAACYLSFAAGGGLYALIRTGWLK